MMQCPNNNACNVVFYSEEMDSGDSSTPYFSSWSVLVYDAEESEHMPECPPLTQAQIDKMEKEANENPYDNIPEPYLGLD